MARNREETSVQARGLREEVSSSLQSLGDSTTRTLGAIADVQKNQLEAFAGRLAQLSEAGQLNARHLREEMAASLKGFNDSVLKSMADIANLQKNQLDVFATRLSGLTQSNEQRLETLRQTLEQQLRLLQEDNARKLDQMRATVDEKLQGTLDKRLGESFKLVSDRLELVHKGLGEMQTLASGVGDLKRVLSNVKTRGMLGEIQLGNLLEQVLTQEQFARNVATRPGSDERVEFAIRLPGRGSDNLEEVWLPIDAKFPQEDYQRLIEAADRADAAGVEIAAKQLDIRIKLGGREICDKYLEPPYTTDFGIMFLPTEGLYAEVVRRPAALVETLQRECRVVVAGPTTLAALLNSLQMGFRTLAIEKRSSEVWTVLGTVKTEFGKFGDILDSVKKKLVQATDTIDDAARKTRTIERKLRSVQDAPTVEDPQLLLGPSALTGDGAEE